MWTWKYWDSFTRERGLVVINSVASEMFSEALFVWILAVMNKTEQLEVPYPLKLLQYGWGDAHEAVYT